jgi:outer membrane protein TolC
VWLTCGCVAPAPGEEPGAAEGPKATPASAAPQEDAKEKVSPAAPQAAAAGEESVLTRPLTPEQTAELEKLYLPPRKREMTVHLTLDDAIRLGLENSLNIKLSRLDDDIANRSLIAAKAAFDPFFNVASTYAKNRDPSVDIGGIPGFPVSEVVVNPSSTLSYSTGLTGTWFTGAVYDISFAQIERDRPAAQAGGLTAFNPVVSTEVSIAVRQPLLNGAWYSVNAAGIRIAQNNTRFSREQLELTAINTVFDIVISYWEHFFANQNLEAKAKALQVTLENLENTRKRRVVGTLSAVDVTSAESQAALRKSEYVDAALLLETTRDQLLNLINYTDRDSLKSLWETGSKVGPYDNIDLVCTSSPSTEGLDLDRNRALASAFVKRREYRQLELSMRNQEIRVEVAKNELLPNLDVTASWAQLGLDESLSGSWDEFGTGKYYGWSVGAQLSMPLSNRGPRSIYRNSRDELRKLKVQKIDLENIIVLEVDQSIRRIEYLRRKVQDLDERVRHQIELLRAERIRLDVGVSIPYTLSVIENDLVTNVTQALRAKADLQAARVEFLRATGVILDAHRIELGARDPE